MVLGRVMALEWGSQIYSEVSRLDVEVDRCLVGISSVGGIPWVYKADSMTVICGTKDYQV